MTDNRLENSIFAAMKTMGPEGLKHPQKFVAVLADTMENDVKSRSYIFQIFRDKVFLGKLLETDWTDDNALSLVSDSLKQSLADRYPFRLEWISEVCDSTVAAISQYQVFIGAKKTAVRQETLKDTSTTEDTEVVMTAQTSEEPSSNTEVNETFIHKMKEIYMDDDKRRKSISRLLVLALIVTIIIAVLPKNPDFVDTTDVQNASDHVTIYSIISVSPKTAVYRNDGVYKGYLCECESTAGDQLVVYIDRKTYVENIDGDIPQSGGNNFRGTPTKFLYPRDFYVKKTAADRIGLNVESIIKRQYLYELESIQFPD